MPASNLVIPKFNSFIDKHNEIKSKSVLEIMFSDYKIYTPMHFRYSQTNAILMHWYGINLVPMHIEKYFHNPKHKESWEHLIFPHQLHGWDKIYWIKAALFSY